MRHTTFDRSSSSKSLSIPSFPKAKSSSPFTGYNSLWKLDDLIYSYEEFGKLPPILSPTIPNNYDSEDIRKSKRDLDANNEYFIDSSINGTGSGYHRRDQKPGLKQPIPNRLMPTSLEKKSKADSDPIVSKNHDKMDQTFQVKINLKGKSSSREKDESGTQLKGLGIKDTKNSKRSLNLQKYTTNIKQIDHPTSSEKFNLTSITEDQKFTSKRQILLRMANNAKSKANKMEKNLTSLTIGLESILFYIMSYDYDERLRAESLVPPSNKIWKSLDEDILNLIEGINDLLITEEERYNLVFLKIMRCLLFQTRAILLKAINSILLRIIKANLDSSSVEAFSEYVPLSQQVIENESLMMESFKKSKPHLLESILSSKFPKAWSKRTVHLPPESDKFYFPLGIYSTLTEVILLLCSLTNEFIENYNNGNPEHKMVYILQNTST